MIWKEWPLIYKMKGIEMLIESDTGLSTVLIVSVIW
jgi:hypothetical protein